MNFLRIHCPWVYSRVCYFVRGVLSPLARLAPVPILCVGTRGCTYECMREQQCYRRSNGRVKCRAFTRGAARLRGLLRGIRSRATVKPRCALSHLPNPGRSLTRKRVQRALREPRESRIRYGAARDKSYGENVYLPLCMPYFVAILCRQLLRQLIERVWHWPNVARESDKMMRRNSRGVQCTVDIFRCL